MTDKVQKIREAVKKRYECWKEKEFNSHSIESETRMSECKHLLLMLDSLQEEPKPKFEVGQIISKKHNSDINKFGDFRIDSITDGCYWYKGSIICKVSEQDKWELIENPICAFSTNRYTEKDRKVLCKGCDERCEYSKKEELVCKVWHEPIERPNSNKVVLIIVRCGYIGDPGMPHLAKYDSHNNQYIDKDRTDVCNRPIMYHVDSVEKWVYIDDILNLTTKEEPVSEDIWETSKQYALRQVLASTDTEMTEQAYLALNMFSGHELAVAHKDGMLAMKQQMMANAVDGAFIRRNRYTKKNVLNGLDMTCDATQCFKDKDKIKVLFIKED